MQKATTQKSTSTTTPRPYIRERPGCSAAGSREHMNKSNGYSKGRGQSRGCHAKNKRTLPNTDGHSKKHTPPIYQRTARVLSSRLPRTQEQVEWVFQGTGTMLGLSCKKQTDTSQHRRPQQEAHLAHISENSQGAQQQALENT